MDDGLKLVFGIIIFIIFIILIKNVGFQEANCIINGCGGVNCYTSPITCRLCSQCNKK
jgi:hypothetical protein